MRKPIYWQKQIYKATGSWHREMLGSAWLGNIHHSPFLVLMVSHPRHVACKLIFAFSPPQTPCCCLQTIMIRMTCGKTGQSPIHGHPGYMALFFLFYVYPVARANTFLSQIDKKIQTTDLAIWSFSALI